MFILYTYIELNHNIVYTLEELGRTCFLRSLIMNLSGEDLKFTKGTLCFEHQQCILAEYQHGSVYEALSSPYK